MNKTGTFGNWVTWKASQHENDLDMSRYLVRNEFALREGWQAGAESKQAELDNMKFEFERSVREHEECKRYADNLNMVLDKANAELAALKQELQALREQKPVAWQKINYANNLPQFTIYPNNPPSGLSRPLYAAPMPAREGWKLVPSIPTDEMVLAAIDAQDNYPSNSWGKVRDLPYDEVYKAMLEAAPKEPS